MSISEIQLYSALKAKLGEREAEQLVEFVKTEVKDDVDSRTDRFASKEDLANAKVDIIRWMVGTAIAIISLVIAGVKLL